MEIIEGPKLSDMQLQVRFELLFQRSKTETGPESTRFARASIYAFNALRFRGREDLALNVVFAYRRSNAPS